MRSLVKEIFRLYDGAPAVGDELVTAYDWDEDDPSHGWVSVSINGGELPPIRVYNPGGLCGPVVIDEEASQ